MHGTGYIACLSCLWLLLLASGPAVARPHVLVQAGRTADTARITTKNLPVRLESGDLTMRNLSLTVPRGVAARFAASASESLTVSALREGKQIRVRLTAGYGCNTVVIDRGKQVKVMLGTGSSLRPQQLTTRKTRDATAFDPLTLGRPERGSRRRPWYASTARYQADESNPHLALGQRRRAASASFESRLGQLGADLSSKVFGGWQEMLTSPQVRGIHPSIQHAAKVLTQVLHRTYVTGPSPLRLKRGEIAEHCSSTGFGPMSSKGKPDPKRPYKEVWVQSKGCTYFTEVKLQLRPGDDLDKIATVLAVGRNPKPIARELRRHLKAGRTELPLQELLPAFVRDNVGSLPSTSMRSRNGRDGPNCYNSALGFSSKRATPRFTQGATFKRTLQRSYKLLQPGEQIRFGDVVVLWGHSYNHKDVRKGGKVEPFGAASPVHAAVYLDKGILFGKPANSMDNAFVFENYAGAFAKYTTSSKGKNLITVHRKR